MKFKNVKFYILAIISLLITFFIFPINAFAEDTGYVEYQYTAFHEYTGQDIYLDDLVLTFNGTTLVKDVDYRISYNDSDLVSRGTKTINLTIDEDNDYVTEQSTKTDVITYYVIDKIINLDDYGISEGMTVEKANGSASLNSLAAPLTELYSDYLSINDSTTQTSTGSLYISFDTTYDTVIYYKDQYNHQYYSRSTEGDPFLNINFNAVDHLISANDERIEIDNLDNIAYTVGSTTNISWSGSISFENRELTSGTDYDTYLYLPAISGDETEVISFDEEYADGSVYELLLLVVFKGDYGGLIRKTIKLCPTISNADMEALEGATITTSASGETVTFGYGITTLPINLKLTIGGAEKTLVYGTDFTCDSSIFWGSATMGGNSTNLKGIGNYAGTLEMWYELTPKSLNSDSITYDADANAYYDGENNPYLGIIIYDANIIGDNKVISSDEFTISYNLDTENNTGIATIAGQYEYKDSFEVEFILARRKWSDQDFNFDIDWDTTYDSMDAMEYTKTKKIPPITLTYGTDTLVEGTDYDVTLEGDYQAGGTSQFTITLKGDYYGRETFTFYVLPILSGTLDIEGIPDYVIYNEGNNIFGLTIKDQEGTTLTEGTDYDIRYTNNVSYGIATYTISFKGNYEGTSEGEFYIVDEVIDLASYNIDLDYVYGIIEDGHVSVNNVFNQLLTDYSGKISVSKLEDDVAEPTQIESEISVDPTLLLFYEKNNEKIYVYGNYNFYWGAGLATITKDDPLLDISINLENTDYYIGQGVSISQVVSISYNGESLTADDYNIETHVYDNDLKEHFYNDRESGISNDDADGSVYIVKTTITFSGKYYGVLEYESKACPSIENNTSIIPLDDARVDGNNLYYEYKGKAIEPSFDLLLSINDDETKTLKYGTDFTLSDSDFVFDRIDVTNGSVEFLLKGIGNYGGTAYVYYEIEPKDIENVSINSSKNCYRDGTDLLYDLELFFEDIEFYLVKDTDYTIEYSIVADENKANFKLTGINNFTGENNELSLPLATKKLDDLNITIKYDKEDENVMYFTGSENVPNIIIEDNDSNILVKDTDYIVEYIGDFTTYGETIAFNIIGINDVYGIYSDEFSLESNIIAEIELEYRGKAKLSVYLENSQYKDYLKEYEDIDIEEAKKYELLVTLNDGYIFNNEEEYSASGILSIIINKYVIDEALEISSEDVYYNGKDIEIDLNVLDKYENVLIKDKDYNVTFENNDKAGTAKAILEGINNYSGTFNYEFEIKGKDISKNISFDTDNNIYFNVDTDSYLFNVTLTDDELEYSLIKEKDYTLSYEIIDNLNAKIIIEGINNYSGTLTKDVKIASKLLSEITIDVKYDSKEDNINVMNYTGVETLPIIKITDGEDELIKERDYIINIIGDFKEYASTINFEIVGINNYYGKYSDEYIIKTTVIDEIINESAKEIVSTATESSEFNLNELDFEKLTGLSKDELLKAKEFYNNLEKYVVDKGLDILVNENLRELGYDTVLEASDIALRLKEYLDEYAVNSGYTNFDSQIDDAINALEIEETKDVAKEELNAFIHRHTKASTMDKLHSVVGEQEEILNSLYYEKWTDDESRAAYFEELNNKVHEIKNVSLVIVKHTQSQAIANNNIEAYYEELKNSGKYNEAQLQLLKEVFDEMQEKVEAVLYASKEEDQLAIQEQLNKIVEEAIEKLSGVEISSISTNPDGDNYCIVESTLGMNGKTTLEIENASKNVSFTISRAINSGNVKGEENGILLIKNKDVKEAFDIDLLVDDNKVEEFKGVYTVKILLTDELKKFSNLQIIYIAEDGSLEVHETHVDGDYLVFTTSHFSIYYLLGDKVFDFAPIIKILLSVIAALIIFNVYLVLKIKKKKINELLLVLSFGFVPLSAMISINVLIVSIILGIIAFILLVVAILLAIKDYKIDRRLADEE